jgi:hypothetical protein
MPFDHATRERQRQSEASSPFVEWRRFPGVCLLYAAVVCKDDDSAWMPVMRVDPALRDDG